MRFPFVAFAVLLTTVAAQAEIVGGADSWTVSPVFEKNNEAREALSGAACVTGTNRCLAVNDEKKYAQFFDILGHRLAPDEVIRLLPDAVDGLDMNEIDAEGAAYTAPTNADANHYFYVVGSHGRGRQGELRPSAFFLFRFPIDPSTGRPTFSFGDDEAAPKIQRTGLLREAIRNQPDLAAYAEQELDSDGVTIEGLAFHGTDLLLGFRGPSLDGNALVMRVPIAELFGAAPPSSGIVRLPLGECVGIRDLASVSGGVLILAGRSDDRRHPTCEARPPASVWFWSGKEGEAPKTLGVLPGLGPDDKAEALIVLQDAQPSYRFLILFDGKANGGPMEFSTDGS